MSSVKISNLPQAPQNWNLTDILAVVDSGSTQTSKQTLEYLFGNWEGQTITSANQYFIAGNGTDVNKITINASNRGVIVASESAEIQGGSDNFIAASREDGSGHATITSSEACAFIATRGYESIQNSSFSAHLASRDSNIYGRENNSIISSQIVDIAGDSYKTSAIASDSNGSIFNSNASVLIGSSASNVNMANGFNGVVIGSNASNAYPLSSSARATGIYSSYGSINKSNNFVSTIIGSFNSDIDDTNAGSGIRASSILNGYDSEILAEKPSGLAYNQAMFNTYQTFIKGNVSYTNTIIGSDTSTISGGSNNMIVGSVSADVIGRNGSVMLGVSNNDALYDNTVHTDNLHTFKTETFDVFDAGSVSGSIDVDCSRATIYKFQLDGSTTPNFINVRTGQRFIFIVYNNGNHSVPSASVNGVANSVYAKNGNISPSNSGYTKYTATYDGTFMFLDEELGFAPV